MLFSISFCISRSKLSLLWAQFLHTPPGQSHFLLSSFGITMFLKCPKLGAFFRFILAFAVIFINPVIFQSSCTIDFSTHLWCCRLKTWRWWKHCSQCYRLAIALQQLQFHPPLIFISKLRQLRPEIPIYQVFSSALLLESSASYNLN